MRPLASTTVVLPACLLIACGAAPLPPDQLVEAYVARTQAADRTYRAELAMVSYTGARGLGGGEIRYSATVEVAGADRWMAYTAHLPDVPLEDQRAEVLLLDGSYFWRDATSGGWQQTDEPAPLVRLDPLSGLAAQDLEYVGPDSSVAENLHLLRARDPAAAAMRALQGATGPGATVEIDAETTSIEHYVDGAGLPVATVMRLRGLTHQQGATAFSVELEYAYSHWGDQIVIQRPFP